MIKRDPKANAAAPGLSKFTKFLPNTSSGVGILINYRDLYTDDMLMEIYSHLAEEDPGIDSEAVAAYLEMQQVPGSEFESGERVVDVSGAVVSRRAPRNPLTSARLRKLRKNPKEKSHKVKLEDPALKNNPLKGRLILTFTSTAALLFIFLQSLCLNKTETGYFHAGKDINKLLGPIPKVLESLGGLSASRLRNKGEPYRLFWAMLMHAGWIHIGINVVSQLQYLYMLEPDWGFWRVLLVFFASGLSGNMLSSLLNPCSITVGSSGALFGLMGAIIPYCIEYWTTIPRPGFLLLFCLIVLVISLLTGLLSSNTDNWAHIGGMIGGICMGFATLARYPVGTGLCTPKLRRLDSAKPENKQNKMMLVVVDENGEVKKRKIHRDQFSRAFKSTIAPNCRCGFRECATRIFMLGILIIFWSVSIHFIFFQFRYQPFGQITFNGVQKCCCCESLMEEKKVWTCEFCQTKTEYDINWEEYCKYELASNQDPRGRKSLAESLRNLLRDSIQNRRISSQLSGISTGASSDDAYFAVPIDAGLSVLPTETVRSEGEPTNTELFAQISDGELINWYERKREIVEARENLRKNLVITSMKCLSKKYLPFVIKNSYISQVTENDLVEAASEYSENKSLMHLAPILAPPPGKKKYIEVICAEDDFTCQKEVGKNRALFKDLSRVFDALQLLTQQSERETS